MILFIDDDEAMHAQVREALTSAGLDVRGFHRATEALEFVVKEEPELILSEVVLPEMGGFAFLEAYAERYPHRRTPFLFLSSLADPSDMVRGLELGADDYLTKPFVPKVLAAKVGAHLRRARTEGRALFRGDLARYPFAKLMQLCEVQGFTGDVEVTGPGCSVRFEFKAGTPTPESLNASEDPLGRCLALTEGQFVLQPRPLDLMKELRGAESDAASWKPAKPAGKPTGRLSGVRVNNRLFQIQTEFTTSPACQAITVVMLDGKAVLKRISAPAAGYELAAAERLVTEQHLQVESEVRQKLESLEAKLVASAKNEFNRLIEDGLACFLSRDYAGAVKLWEQAQAVEPGNKMVEVNLGVAHKKLGAFA